MKTVLIFALLTTNAFSATFGTLILQGIVPQKISVIVTAQPVASALDLETTATDLNVASVNEKSNSNTGYKVTLTSTNLSLLKRSGGTETINYTAKYNGSPLALNTIAGTTFTNPSGIVANVNKILSISYVGALHETRVEGTYSDTITITIAAN